VQVGSGTVRRVFIKGGWKENPLRISSIQCDGKGLAQVGSQTDLNSDHASSVAGVHKRCCAETRVRYFSGDLST
jgi:hypothetical protein